MKLGFVSDSPGGLPLTVLLDHAVRLGVQGVEINTCGWSTAPHFDLRGMLGNGARQKAFQWQFTDRGLEIISLNANGNPLHPTDTMPNWVVSSWPPQTQAILRYPWEEKLLPFWTEIVALARSCGVERIALELYGNQCVYNVPSLLKLRAAVGPVVGANLDPSHLFWMGADPLVAAEVLGQAIYMSMPRTLS